MEKAVKQQVQRAESRVHSMTVHQCFSLMKAMQSTPQPVIESINRLNEKLEAKVAVLQTNNEKVSRITRNIMSEAKTNLRKNPLRSLEEQEQDYDKFKQEFSGTTFPHTLQTVFGTVYELHISLLGLSQTLIPRELRISKKVLSSEGEQPDTTEELQKQMYEFELNKGTVLAWASALLDLHYAEEMLKFSLYNCTSAIENLYHFMSHRHIIEKMKVYENVLVTDLALTIYRNVDAHGEIENGLSPDQLNSYSLGRALSVCELSSDPQLRQIFCKPDLIVESIEEEFRSLLGIINNLKEILGEQLDTFLNTFTIHSFPSTNFNVLFESLQQLNPSLIRSSHSDNFLSKDEKFNFTFEDETLTRLSKDIMDSKPPREILQYILERKHFLKKHFQEENTFYVCKIGAGNPFVGQAPGALQVIPAEKPSVTFDHIVGSNFPKVKEFFEAAESGQKFQPLFMATSPSKSADKSNLLMLGPPGCGKSEIMRAVGNDPRCLAIFAQGSDFLTCWKGEADKNPKRLFQEATKLHKEANKRVYILIDEIDSVVHNPEGPNDDVNLTTEFQNLMDGVVSYPGISVWAASNFPQRIPLAMIRRFQQVLIVGELETAERIFLIKHFLSYLPNNIDNEAWKVASDKLEGATGDVIRKIADDIWRTKLDSFVKNNPKKAESISKWLIDQTGGEFFDILSFEEDKRKTFKSKIESDISVNNNDLLLTVETFLKNPAIHDEIVAAKNTYSNSKRMMRQMDGNSNGRSLIIDL